MKKSISITLIVVMLAALFAMLPANAMDINDMPQLVITEILVDTTGWSGAGGDDADPYEYIEILNTGSTSVNLYEYSLFCRTVAVGYGDPGDYKLEKINPIMSPADSVNPFGTIGTSAQAENDPSMYVTNPTEAVLEPGKVALIWIYSYDTYNSAKNAKGAPITFDEFKNYWRMDKYNDEALEDILIVAVDGNGSKNSGKAFTPDDIELGTFNYYGANNTANDLTGQFNGRFNLANSYHRAYGIIKTADIDVSSTKAPTTLINDSISYTMSTYNSSTKDINQNLMYEAKSNVGRPRVSSRADISYNFIYTDDASSYDIGKAAGNKKFADWDCMSFATPGMLLPSQMESMKDNSVNISENLGYIQNRVVKDETSMLYTVYQESFYGMGATEEIAYDPSNAQKYKDETNDFLGILGWEMIDSLNGGGTIRYSIENEKLVCNNLNTDSLSGKDSVALIFPTLKAEKIAKSDYTIEYELTYLDAQETDAYAGLVYNFNEKSSYDVFVLHVAGHGDNQRRLGGTVYTSYDAKDALYAADNTDSGEAQTSIVNKLTNGDVLVTASSSKDIKDMNYEEKLGLAPLLGRTLNVRIEVNQVTGPELYINDILVSKATTLSADPDDPNSVVAAHPFWGAQTNYNEFAFGFFVSSQVKVALDNVKITGWVNKYTEVDMIIGYENAENKEPATGDATIYVVIAMAVSFISLSALIVVKRKKSSVK